MITMQRGEGRAHPLTDHPEQRLGEHIDHDHRGAVLAGRGGDFTADPAGADHHDPGVGRQAIA